MQFSSITVLLFFLYYIYQSGKSNKLRTDLKSKYNYFPWHYGFFADRKLYKMLNEEDKKMWKQDGKRLDRILLIFLLYSILISMTSGIFFGGKL